MQDVGQFPEIEQYGGTGFIIGLQRMQATRTAGSHAIIGLRPENRTNFNERESRTSPYTAQQSLRTLDKCL